MGQKVDPRGFRLGITRKHDSKWYADKKHFADLLHEDIILREYIEEKYKGSEISRVFIERPSNGEIDIFIHCYRVGSIIGRKGEELEFLKKQLEKKVKSKKINIKVQELNESKIDAKVLGEMIATSIEKRTPYKKAINQALNRAKKTGLKGVKVSISGRLNGAEIARTEVFSFGKVPLHTLRYKIDYATIRAQTISGVIGLKIWLSEGELLG